MELADISKYALVPIDKLVAAEWNYKKESESMTSKLVENMRRNGQVENVLVRELDNGTYEVVNGNHRVAAMRQIGASNVIAYNLGKISDEEAYRISIETNETSFDVNYVQLSKLIKSLGGTWDMEELLKTLPYDQSQIDNFLKMNDFDWNALPGNDSSTSGTDSAGGDEGVRRVVVVLEDEEAQEWESYLAEHGLEGASGDKEALLKLLREAI